MQNERPVTEFDRDHRAEIIERLYEVAVDPARYEVLLDIWESRIAPLRPKSGGAAEITGFRDPEIEAHLERAWLFLDRFEETVGKSAVVAALSDVGRAAAFVSVDGKTIHAANASANQIFGIGTDSHLSSLPLEAEDLDALGSAVRDITSRRREKALLMRGRSPRTGGPIVLRVLPLQDGPTLYALVVTTELAWPDGLSDTIREAFDLTLAEVEIVRAITEGRPVKEIALDRGRSTETVRTQLRSILAKTETHSQSELIRIILGLMDVVGVSGERQGVPVATPGKLRPIPFSTITTPDGRRLDYIEFGDPGGRPCLFLPIDYGLTRWPASAEQAAERRGMRVIVPIRAGYGHSSPMPHNVHYAQQCAIDFGNLLKHLGVRRAAVVALGADLRFAMRMAIADAASISAILGCAAMLPVRTPQQYDRMDKWQRFILANARYAPKILPFLVKAGYSMARRLGKERFFAAVNGGSPSDIRAFSQPEIREAMLLGSEVCLSDWHSAHMAFARETIDSEIDWSAIVHACPVPVKLIQGGQDPQSPAATVRELMLDFPKLEVEFIEEAGQLLFFQEWPRVLNELEPLLPPA